MNELTDPFPAVWTLVIVWNAEGDYEEGTVTRSERLTCRISTTLGNLTVSKADIQYHAKADLWEVYRP